MSISHLASVHPGAQLGPDVEVGPFSIVHDEVQVGRGSRIGSHCEIGVPSAMGVKGVGLRIGERANIRSHSVFYLDSEFGDSLETGHRVTVRERTRCGEGVRIGTLSDIQGDCTIGDYTRLHSSVFIAKGCSLGRFVWLFPHVVLTNDPTPPSDTHWGSVIDDYAVVAAKALILPGVKVGRGAVVAASACVGVDVPAEFLAVGVPARILGPASAVLLRGLGGQSAYPWRRHFSRGYPEEVVAAWRKNSDAKREDEANAT